MACGCTIERDQSVGQDALPRARLQVALTRAWPEEPRATRSRETGRALVRTTERTVPRENLVGATRWEKPEVRRVRNRRSKGRRKSSVPLVERKAPWTGESPAVSRQQGRSGLGGLRRIGTRAPRKSTPRHRVKIATTASEARSRGECGSEKVPYQPTAVRRSDAERRESLSSPVSTEGTPSSARPTKSR